MANLDFYAVREDIIALTRFIFESTDFRVFESYSEFGQELREFKSPQALEASFSIGNDPQGNGTAVLLQLWSPSVSSNINVERLAIDPARARGHTFRYRIEGWGLVQLYLGGLTPQNSISHSHIGHNSPERALKWAGTQRSTLGPVSAWDWPALAQRSRRLQYHVRKRLASSKLGSRPVLHAAEALRSQGLALS